MASAKKTTKTASKKPAEAEAEPKKPAAKGKTSAASKKASPAKAKASAAKASPSKKSAAKTSSKKTADKTSEKTASKASSKSSGAKGGGESALVIVESPAKARTIKKYLGGKVEVMASVGHIKDLPKSKIGVDIEHDFQPEYVPIRGKGKILTDLKKAARSADIVYLAAFSSALSAIFCSRVFLPILTRWASGRRNLWRRGSGLPSSCGTLWPSASRPR